jgi:hypothetical protein
MSKLRPGSLLVGRDAECAVPEGLVAGARAGTSGALVITGAAGIGKTSLVKSALGKLCRLHHHHHRRVETEAGMAYSSLHRLLAAFLPSERLLPDPQRDALDTVFGNTRRCSAGAISRGARGAHGPDRRGAPATAGLHRRRRSLDRPAVVARPAFVGRRLFADPLVLVFVARSDTEAPALLAGLPAMVLDALDRDAQLALLNHQAP